jgi:hypothetical protein
MHPPSACLPAEGSPARAVAAGGAQAGAARRQGSEAGGLLCGLLSVRPPQLFAQLRDACLRAL